MDNVLPFDFVLNMRVDENATRGRLQRVILKRIAKSRYRFEQVFLIELFNTLHLLHSTEVIEQWLHYKFHDYHRCMVKTEHESNIEYHQYMMQCADLLTLINKFNTYIKRNNEQKEKLH